jgi:hypothetical protein
MPSFLINDKSERHSTSNVLYSPEKKGDGLPTGEERIEALERALSTIRAKQLADRHHLEERSSARIRVLQQQVAEQRGRLSEPERAIGQMGQQIGQRFDS